MATAPNLEPQTIYELFCVDFESAWDALAATSPDAVTGRGNFMFARSAMGLLEFSSRLCADDQSGQTLDDFSAELGKVDGLILHHCPQRVHVRAFGTGRWSGRYRVPEIPRRNYSARCSH
jgi:hypothetical protein